MPRTCVLACNRRNAAECIEPGAVSVRCREGIARKRALFLSFCQNFGFSSRIATCYCSRKASYLRRERGIYILHQWLKVSFKMPWLTRPQPPASRRMGTLSKSSWLIDRLTTRWARIRSSHFCCSSVKLRPVAILAKVVLDSLGRRQQRFFLLRGVLDHRNNVYQILRWVTRKPRRRLAFRRLLECEAQRIAEFFELGRVPVCRSAEQDLDRLMSISWARTNSAKA